MKNVKRAILLVLCAVLLMTASVMGTMAYLQMQTNTVTNVMTVGNVSITLTESQVTPYGEKTGTTLDASTANVQNSYILIPGLTYTKDPTVTVVQGSEECYVFVKIENGLSGALGTSIDDQIEANGWTKLTGVTGVDNVYFKLVPKDSANDTKLPVLTSFTIDSQVTSSQLAVYTASGNTISVTAYAVQAIGMSGAAQAWTEANFS